MEEEESQKKLDEVVYELKELRRNLENSSEKTANHQEDQLEQSEKESQRMSELFPEWLQNALDKNRKAEALDRKKEKGPRKVKDEEKKDPLAFLKGSFSGLMDKLDVLAEDDKNRSKEKQSESWLSKLLGPGSMLLISGLAALVAAFSGFGGPFKGLLESFGKWGTMGGLKLIGGTFKTMFKMIGGFLAKFLRRIPIVGGLVSFGFAYNAFKNGDYLGGVLDIVSGILNLLPFGFTQVLSFGVDMFNAYLDYQNKPDESGKKPGKLNIIKEMCEPIWNFIKPFAKAIPILGTFLYGKEAIDAFKSGDIGKGLWKMLGALSTMIPTVGPLLMEGASAMFGFTDDDFEKAKEGKPSKGIQFAGMLKDWAVEKLAKGWTKLPWWVKKALKKVMPASVVKLLESGGPKTKEPQVDDPVPSSLNDTKKLDDPDKPTARKKRLTKTNEDLKKMSTNDLRNLRDEHGTDWDAQDYQRIQTVLEDRASGKTYEEQNLGPQEEKPLTFNEKILKSYTDKFENMDATGGSDPDAGHVPWFDQSVQKMSDGGLVQGGSGVKDDVPALLQAGEFVTSRETVQTLGAEFFENQNRITSKSEASTNAAQKARDKLSQEMLKEIQVTNELHKSSMKQQQQLSKVHQEILQATRELVHKDNRSVVSTVSNTSFNVSGKSSIQQAREASRRR